MVNSNQNLTKAVNEQKKENHHHQRSSVLTSLKRSLANLGLCSPHHEPKHRSHNHTNNLSAQLVITPRLLGKGTSSEVFFGYDCKTFQKLAIKTIKANRLSFTSKLKLQKEVEILSKLRNSNPNNQFVNLHSLSTTPDKVYLAMEYVDGEDLFFLCNEYSLGIPEAICKKIFFQIVQSVFDLHNLDICHLDLKLENVMYNRNTQHVTIIDFGFSQFTSHEAYTPSPLSDQLAFLFDEQYCNHCEEDDEMDTASSSTIVVNGRNQILQTSFCGSIHYAAPELLNRIPFDGKKADVWSLAVLLFAMLCGQFPFDDVEGQPAKIFEKIKNNQIHFPPHFSTLVTDLLSHMFERNPNERYSIEEVLTHPYFSTVRSTLSLSASASPSC